MKKLFTLTICIMAILLLTGCEDESQNMTLTAYTSTYPVEYILDNLYGENIAIYSIYPDGTYYNSAKKLTDKQLTDYSNGDLFVYNSTLDNEKEYAVKMLNKNKKLKIIDASLGMNIQSDASTNWLNPSNFLMMASNIRKGLKEYISEKIEIKKIDNNYENLKLSLSEIDADLKETYVNAKNKTLIVSSDSFKYLEKYGFTVISLEQNDNLTDKIISDAKKMYTNKEVQYVFIKDNEEKSELINDLESNYGAKVISLNSISTLTAEQRVNDIDYMSLMKENIGFIKLETNE